MTQDRQNLTVKVENSDEEEIATRGVAYIDVEEVEPISRLPPYILPWNTIAMKPTKDSDTIKYNILTPLLSEKVHVEGDLLGKVPKLQMEDWDFNDCSKYQ